MSLMLEEKVKAPWKWAPKFMAGKVEVVPVIPVDKPTTNCVKVPEEVKALPFPLAGFTAESAKPVMDWELFTAYTESYKVPVEVKPDTLAHKFKVALREVITEAGPGYVCLPRSNEKYDGMKGFRYVYEGKGDCLVGRVLIRMGQAPESLRQVEGIGAPEAIRRLYGNDPEVTDLIPLASAAQAVNDRMLPWSAAMHLVYGV